MKSKIVVFIVFLSVLCASCGSSVVSGEAFIVTRGAGNYKLGAVEVKFFEKARIETIKARGEAPAYGELTPAGQAMTNSDGKFSLQLPSGDYVAVAAAEREVGAETEEYEWELPVTVSGKTQLLLSSSNAKVKQP